PSMQSHSRVPSDNPIPLTVLHALLSGMKRSLIESVHGAPGGGASDVFTDTAVERAAGSRRPLRGASERAAASQVRDAEASAAPPSGTAESGGPESDIWWR